MSSKNAGSIPNNVISFKSKDQLESNVFQEECDDATRLVKEALNTLEEGNDEIRSMREEWKKEDEREKGKMQMAFDTRMAEYELEDRQNDTQK